MLCSKDPDRWTRYVYAEPCESEQIRIMATDGHAALFLKANALHDLDRSVLVEPVDKKPQHQSAGGFSPTILLDADATNHPLSRWKESLDKWMPKKGEKSLQAVYDSRLLLRLAKALDVLGCRAGLHARPSDAAVLTLSYGDIETDEIGMAILMPLHRPMDDPFDVEEVWTNYEHFSN